MKRLLFVPLATALLVAPTFSCSDDPGTGLDNGDDEPYSHVRAPGSSANDFLSGESFTSLVVEVDYMPGYAPNANALDQLQAFLEERLHKTSVTIRAPTEVAAGGQASYTANEIRDLEEQHRDEFTEGETLVAYMIIVDGEFEQNNVLGIAYFNTSNAFFGPAYEQASGGLGQPSRYLTEATSFRHEFGHLFGLVGIPGSGTDMQTEHKDEEHGNHCDDDQCLMYYALANPGLIGGVIGSDIPALDPNCLDDVAANGGK